ncbi:MAG TPA: cysteine synthase family protein [Saprospiraceae bacterium]|nr:cysteine synthase family protein [Saprospiraceae bacterium]
MQAKPQIYKRYANLQAHVNIGDTPLVPVPSLSRDKVQILAKLEWEQAGGSVKARAANQIIRIALQQGHLKKGIALLDASSGNTAIAYATLLKRLHLQTVICLPSNASARRLETLHALGAEVILTSSAEGTEGAQVEAKKILAANPDEYFYADQYSNPSNWQAHYLSTGPEIIAQTKGKVTHFVAGLGTTGTFSGTAKRLKEYHPAIQMITLQPNCAMHGLEGWKHLATANVPRVYDPSLADAQIEVDSEEAYEMIRYIRKHEGYLISPSAAANLIGAYQVAQRVTEGLIVTVLPDALERYDEVSQLIFGEIFS